MWHMPLDSPPRKRVPWELAWRCWQTLEQRMQNPGLANCWFIAATVGQVRDFPTLAGKRPMPWNLPSGIMKAQGMLGCCTKWHQVESPEASPDSLAENAPGCFPKIKGKAWFRQHLPEDGKTAVELVGCNLHVLGRFGAVKLYEIVDVQNCAIEIC